MSESSVVRLETREPAEAPQEMRPAPTVNDAYERVKERKDAAADARALSEARKAPEAPKQPEYTPETPAEPEDGVMWSTEDVELIRLFESESARLSRDMAAFQQASAVDLSEIEKTDRSRAKAIRTQLKQAEQELQQRQQTLTQAAQELMGKTQEAHVTKAQRILETERAKLQQAMPGVNLTELTDYLKTQFTAEELAMAGDHRLFVLAEKARRYDAMKQEKPEMRTVRKVVKKQTVERGKEGPDIDALRERLRKRGQRGDALALLQAKRELER